MPRDNDYDHTVPRRSDGTKQTQRVAQPWPANKPFKILSIDGGGIPVSYTHLTLPTSDLV